MTRTTNRPAIRRTAAFTGGLAALAAAAVLAGGASAAPAPGHSNLAGGGAAPAGAYPFVAGLRDAGFTRFFCTGTLIESSWVLTAAHCVDDRTSAEVVIGDTNLDTATDPAEVRGVDRVIIHPRWGGGTGDRNDAALLHLSTPSTLPVVPLAGSKRLTDGLRRCVQQRATAMAMRSPAAYLPCKAGAVHAVGWGRTPGSTATSKVLKHARGSVWDTGPRGMWRAKTGACPGDSGGPILVEQPDGSLTQIGVASANQHGGGWFDWLVGGRCSTKGWDFYTNVLDSQVSRWITVTAVPTPPAPTPSPVTGGPSRAPVVVAPGTTPPVVTSHPARPPVVRVPGGPVVPDGGGPILVQ